MQTFSQNSPSWSVFIHQVEEFLFTKLKNFGIRNHRDRTNDTLNQTKYPRPWHSKRRSPTAPPLFSFFRITGTGQLIRWIKCPRPWDKVDDTFLKKWSYSWFCWLGYSSWRFDGFSCNSLIFSERRNRHSWYLTVLNRQTVKPSRHFSQSDSALVTWPTRYTSPTSSTIEPSSRPSWKTLQTRENLHIFMRPPCIPLATLLGRLSFWHP